MSRCKSRISSDCFGLFAQTGVIKWIDCGKGRLEFSARVPGDAVGRKRVRMLCGGEPAVNVDGCARTC